MMIWLVDGVPQIFGGDINQPLKKCGLTNGKLGPNHKPIDNSFLACPRNSQSMRNMMNIHGVWGHHILRQSQVELLYTKCFLFFYEHINS